MKIVLTGGGTAGHVTPNIALLPELRELGFEIHYIGTADGMERQLIEREKIQYHMIKAGKLRRYIDIKNLTDMFKIGRGFFQALSLMRKLKPDVVFSKGGFVSCPVVWAAWICRIPAVIHESDMTPGLANRLSIPFAKKVCLTFPETEKHIKNNKGILTGIPIRESILKGDAEAGRKKCGFSGNKPVVLVIGGSLGSGKINSVVRSCLESLLESYQVCHICGEGGVDVKLDGIKGYRQFEYVNEELPDLFCMADIIVGRSGATVLYELLALKKPNLLIPLSKQASRGDQILNAGSFAKQGFSAVLPEEELQDGTLLEGINSVLKNREAFIKNMSESGIGNGTDRVIKVIKESMGYEKV